MRQKQIISSKNENIFRHHPAQSEKNKPNFSLELMSTGIKIYSSIYDMNIFSLIIYLEVSRARKKKNKFCDHPMQSKQTNQSFSFEIMSTGIEDIFKYLWYEYFLAYYLLRSQPCKKEREHILRSSSAKRVKQTQVFFF